MKTAFVWVVIIIGLVGGFLYLNHLDKEEERAYIEYMKNTPVSDIEPLDVDRLWHWKNEHNVSKEFMDLYNDKIRPLPGWRF